MIFGHLRTSTNYNKEEEDCIGGKNGFGFKLVLSGQPIVRSKQLIILEVCLTHKNLQII